ncbi:MAG: aspartate/glutamate racemase family protein [Bacillota bacterium]
MIGVIRVLTTADPQVLNRHGELLEARFNLPTFSRCIPDQPTGVHSDETEAIATPKIVALAREMVDQGARALFISCASDPALAETRQAVSLPVVSAGSAGAAAALALGGRIGVLSITDRVPPAMARILGERVVALERPEGVTNTTHLLEPGAVDRSLASARKLVDQGADTILFACTGFVTIGMAPRIQRELGVPAVDPVLAGGLMLSYVLQ